MDGCRDGVDDEQAAEDALVRAQFHGLVPDIPRLYATVVIVVAFVFLLLLPVSPVELSGAWAAILIVVAVLRAAHWRRVAQQLESFTVAEMRTHLASINKIGFVLLSVFGSAGFLALLSPDLLLRAVTILAIWAAAIGTACYLSLLPRCSRDMVIGTTACLCGVLAWSGGRTFYISAPLFAVISYAYALQLRRNFHIFRTNVEANRTIAALREEAMRMATTDPLTGLPNRRAFEERLAMLAADARPFAVAAIDLDGFKPVNDAFGHGVGDRALILVAQRLQSLSPSVFAARLGGDEFVLLIEGTDFIESLIQRIIDALSAPYEIEPVPIRIGASGGLAYWRKHGDEDEILKRADAALYLAKAHPDRDQEHESGRCIIVKSAA